MYKKIFIKSVDDLPKVEDEYYVHTPEDGLTVFNWYGANFSSNWLKHVDWYLLSYDLNDSDIEAWADEKSKETFIRRALKIGAKAVLNGEIKHIEKSAGR